MCYRIQNSADVRTEMVRIAREQIALAAAELTSKTNPANKIHNVRRCLKRVRSVLKLIGPKLPPQFIEAEDQQFRELGRSLAAMRDYYVGLQTFDTLKLPQDLRNPLRLALANATDVKKGVAELATLKIKFNRASKRVNDWPLPPMHLGDLAEGLEMGYREARTAFKKARKTPLPRKLHRWRQRVKVLEHSLRLIEAFCPKSIRHEAKKSDLLADRLGDLNDLSLLAQNLEKLKVHPGATKAALDSIAQKGEKLQKGALNLGKKVFHDKPGAFTKKYRSFLTPKTTHD